MLSAGLGSVGRRHTLGGVDGLGGSFGSRQPLVVLVALVGRFKSHHALGCVGGVGGSFDSRHALWLCWWL